MEGGGQLSGWRPRHSGGGQGGYWGRKERQGTSETHGRRWRRHGDFLVEARRITPPVARSRETSPPLANGTAAIVVRDCDIAHPPKRGRMKVSVGRQGHFPPAHWLDACTGCGDIFESEIAGTFRAFLQSRPRLLSENSRLCSVIRETLALNEKLRLLITVSAALGLHLCCHRAGSHRPARQTLLVVSSLTSPPPAATRCASATAARLHSPAPAAAWGAHSSDPAGAPAPSPPRPHPARALSPTPAHRPTPAVFFFPLLSAYSAALLPTCGLRRRRRRRGGSPHAHPPLRLS